jgi:nucleoside-diphosphate-sugar epimerase
MNIVITGAAGFLGRRLAQTLLERGTLGGPDGRPEVIREITLVDVVASDLSDQRLRHVTGDISDADVLQRALDQHTSAVFHLAAIVSGMAEADFDIGMRVNLDASIRLLEACRAAGTCPKVVFASSIAVFGGPMPATVLDSTALNPQTSYGTQKAVVELLINDYSRRGLVDGRSLRLPTITVRPGRPNAAVSSFVSGIIREPLNGETAICPVEANARVWILSPSAVIECLIVGHDLRADAFGPSRVVNLPGMSVTVGEMVAALERVAGPEAVSRIRWQSDARIAKMVAGWPGAWDNARALSLGFPGDEDFDAIIRAYMKEQSAALSPEP